MAKHDRLYSKSPSVKKDENGKPGVHKPSKADGESMGTEGNPLPGGGDGMPVQAHQAHEMNDRHHKEMKSMHERHASEQHDMHKRHEDEHKKSGGEMINKVEKDAKS